MDPISNDAVYLMVVRRGETNLFLALKDRLEVPGQLHVIWDRRLAERRGVQETVPDEQRRGDRRQTNLIGPLVAFLLAEPTSRPPDVRPAA